MKTKFKLPSRSELASLVRSVRSDISPEYRSSDDPDDETPAICLTVGADRSGRWSYQTGDNSFTGGAYGFASWAVVTVDKGANSFALADEIRSELGDALHSEIESEQYAAARNEERALLGAGLHASQIGYVKSLV